MPLNIFGSDASLIVSQHSTLEMSRDDLPTEPPTPATKTSEALRADLQSVNAHLEALKKEWSQERKTLLGERAALQDATSRLNAQMKTTKEEMKKVVESSQATKRTAINVQEVSLFIVT